jgi:ketol-acid reductoisomerase
VINASSKKAMKAILKDIQSGKFTKQWVKEYQSGSPKYKKFQSDGEKHPIEKVGSRLRALMPWVKKRNIKGAQASYN